MLRELLGSIMGRDCTKRISCSPFGSFSEGVEDLLFLLFCQKVLYCSYSGIEYGRYRRMNIVSSGPDCKKEMGAVGPAGAYYSSSSKFISHEVYFRFLTKLESAPYHCL